MNWHITPRFQNLRLRSQLGGLLCKLRNRWRDRDLLRARVICSRLSRERDRLFSQKVAPFQQSRSSVLKTTRVLTTSKSYLQSALNGTRQTVASGITKNSSALTLKAAETEIDQNLAKEPRSPARSISADTDEDITLLNAGVFEEIPFR